MLSLHREQVAPSPCHVAQNMSGKTEVFAKRNVCEHITDMTCKANLVNCRILAPSPSMLSCPPR